MIDTISEKEFFKILSCRYSVSIAGKVVMPYLKKGMTPSYDRRILYMTAKIIKPKTILEIGTRHGYLTVGLFLNAIDANVYTIDICNEMKINIPKSQKREILPKEKVGKAFRNKIPGIYQILGNSRDIITYSAIKDKKIDFAFIDGNHSFRAVIKDTHNVLKFTKKKSIIFWHNFRNHDDIELALNSLIRSDRLKIFHIDGTLLAFTIL